MKPNCFCPRHGLLAHILSCRGSPVQCPAHTLRRCAAAPMSSPDRLADPSLADRCHLGLARADGRSSTAVASALCLHFVLCGVAGAGQCLMLDTTKLSVLGRSELL